MGFSEDTLLALASTLYFKANWSSQFSESQTQDSIFHGNAGDVECPFMHRSSPCNYYQGENFAAVPLYFQACGNMWLILPDEGTAVDELLRENTELLDLISAPDEWKDQKFLNVNLSVPKFDAVSQMDLQAQLKMLGVKDIFDPERSDLSPAMDDTRQAFVSQISHAARVKIDENGCEAAAFTVINACGAAMPPEEEIDFVLDRPFLFVITGSTDDLLFAGVVNQP